MPITKQTKKHASSSKQSKKFGKPIIIHIDGMPGAGKSYICTKITRADCVCIDTDDIVLYSKNYVDSLIGTSKAMPRTFNSLLKVQKKKVDELITKHTKNGIKIIIFVGVPFMTNTALNDANPRYFIKLDDIGAIYRRVFLRETDKIVRKYDKIKKSISEKKMEEEELDDMVLRATNLALNYPPEFTDYQKLYKHKLARARKNNYKIATQDEIIKAVNALLV
jgi:hypothetical protein